MGHPKTLRQIEPRTRRLHLPTSDAGSSSSTLDHIKQDSTLERTFQKVQIDLDDIKKHEGAAQNSVGRLADAIRHYANSRGGVGFGAVMVNAHNLIVSTEVLLKVAEQIRKDREEPDA